MSGGVEVLEFVVSEFSENLSEQLVIIVLLAGLVEIFSGRNLGEAVGVIPVNANIVMTVLRWQVRAFRNMQLSLPKRVFGV